MTGSEKPVLEADLHAFADSFAGARRRAEILTFLDQRPSEARRLADWCMQNEAIRRMLGRPIVEPFPQGEGLAEPPRLQCLSRDTAGTLSKAQNEGLRRPEAAQRPMGLSSVVGAAIVLGMALGFVGGQALAPSQFGPQPARSPPADPLASFAARAMEAEAVFTGDALHPLEISAKDRGRLIARVGRHLDEPAVVPDLTRFDLALVGGQLLATNMGPAVILLFSGGDGDRIGLVMAHSRMRFDPLPRYFEANGAGAIVWSDGADTLAISGPAQQARLTAIMRQVSASRRER